jgi:hypothetical protein
MEVSRPALAVTIDELVLDGVDPRDPLVAEAVRRALAPALGAQGIGPGTSAPTAAEVARSIGEVDL